MAKYYIAICGEIGAGKGTLIQFLKEGLQKQNCRAESCRFSDIPRAHLARWKIPDTREAMQFVTTTMRKYFGGTLLPLLFREYLSQKKAGVILIDGPRWKEDEEFIRSLPNHILIYITAPRKIRLERINARCENEGEGKIMLQDLMRQEKRAVEKYIPVMGSRADLKFENTKMGKEHLVHFVDNIIKEASPRIWS